MAKRSNVTVSDIAKHVNVTSITVSRAFNKPELVKPDTLKKILQAADELNYVPNAFAKNLKTSDSRLIGIVTDSIDNPFYTAMIKAISREAQSYNYSIMLFDSDGKEELENTAIQTLLSYNVAGIILSPISDNPEYQPRYLRNLTRSHVPVVLVDRVLHASQFSRVVLDNFECGFTIAQCIQSNEAIESVLVLSGPKDSEISQQRMAGAEAARKESGRAIDYQVAYGDYTFDPAYHDTLKHLRDHKTPDAVLGFNQLITLGAMRALKVANLDFERVKVFGISGLPFADIFGSRIPTMNHNPDKAGYQAMHILLEEMKQRPETPTEVVIRSALHVD